MLTSLQTPGYFIKSLEEMRDNIVCGKLFGQGVINRFIHLFGNGIVAEMHSPASTEVIVQLLLTLTPNEKDLAFQMRLSFETAARKYADTYFIGQGVDTVDRDMWFSHLADAVHLGNPDREPGLVTLCETLKPSGWKLKGYLIDNHKYLMQRHLHDARMKQTTTT